MPLAPFQPQVRAMATPEPGQEPVPQELAELSAEQWAIWRRHPVSALVMERYLPAFRRALERQTLDTWLAGKLSLQVEQDARGLIHCAQMIEGLGLDHVRVFYGLETLREKTEREEAAARPRTRPLGHPGY